MCDEVWSQYAKSVKPVKAKKKVVPAALPGKRTAVKTRPADATEVLVAAVRQVKKPKAAVDPQKVTLDKNVERGMRDGSLAPEGRIDLHGLREAEAQQALLRFVAAQVRRGQRRLLVITGKGKTGDGVLRAALPRWCAEELLAGLVLALKPAAAKHGGSGAWYMVLRKPRSRDA